jgi:Zn-dependent peptidase ImmA (M78 family)
MKKHHARSTILLLFIWSVVGIVNCLAEGPLTVEEAQRVIKKHADIWNNDPKNIPLWVVAADSGDSIAIPGITFSTTEKPIAGMSISVQAHHLIVLNKRMVPESLLSTFFHELGHTKYEVKHPLHDDADDQIASETEAIRFSLEALTNEGFVDLAYREAENVKQMANKEPYKSAIARLANDPLWKKYGRVSVSQ